MRDIRAPRILEQRRDDAIGVHALPHAGARPALALVGADHDTLADRPYQNGPRLRHAPPPAASEPFRFRVPATILRSTRVREGRTDKAISTARRRSGSSSRR